MTLRVFRFRMVGRACACEGQAVNMLSKQAQITDKRWYAILEFGQRILSPQVENSVPKVLDQFSKFAASYSCNGCCNNARTGTSNCVT